MNSIQLKVFSEEWKLLADKKRIDSVPGILLSGVQFEYAKRLVPTLESRTRSHTLKVHAQDPVYPKLQLGSSSARQIYKRVALRHPEGMQCQKQPLRTLLTLLITRQ